MAEVLASLKKIGGSEKYTETILWTNASPTANFAQTDITSLAISDYEYLKIVYKPSTTNNFQKNTIIPTSSFTADNDGRYMFGGTTNLNWVRMLVRSSDTAIRIGDSRAYGGTSTDNSTIIPLQIIGCNFR